MGIYDVPATELIDAVAQDLKGKVKQPEWADFVKSGMSRERAPHRRDWFYVRMASVLYRIYKSDGLGTNRLRTYYGGRKNNGVGKHHVYKASGKVIRVCLQELEKQGLLKKEKAGRFLTGMGKSYLNTKAKEIGGKQKQENARQEEERGRLRVAIKKKEEQKKEPVQEVKEVAEKKQEIVEKESKPAEKVQHAEVKEVGKEKMHEKPKEAEKKAK